MSHNLSFDSVVSLFSSQARARVLRVFMLDPRRAYYQRQIEAATGMALRPIQRELERFTQIGLVYKRTEGKRAYYQVDLDHPLAQDLRNIILKSASKHERLRADLSIDPGVRLAFVDATGTRLLIVAHDEYPPRFEAPAGYTVEKLSSHEFLSALAARPQSLEAFLKDGKDLLGRREDVIWHRIAQAGFDVQKLEGVP